MKFDSVIIGGGLAGLVCGIKLSQQGHRCVIISSGQSALHFLSGSFDLLNRLPDGTPVDHPLTAVKELIKMEPEHPYAKLGEIRFEELVREAEQFFSGIGIELEGSATRNHFRVTPMGTLKRTWLTLADFVTCENDIQLPWKQLTIFNPAGFLDFYPHFVADEFRKLGATCEVHEFNLPDLDILRRNPSELRSTNIARILDKPDNREHLCQILIRESSGTDAILLPACLGLDQPDAVRIIEERAGKPVYLIPTIPPSIAGIGMQQFLRNTFQQLGGVYMMGDHVMKADIENHRVKRVYSYNHGDIPFEANHFVLATGSYFSRGLTATRDRVYEPVFNLNVSYLKERQEWYTGNIFDAQAYQQFGISTSLDFQAVTGDVLLSNLYVGGAILEGFNPIKEGSGGGVSILTALGIAGKILKDQSVWNCSI